MTIRSAFQCSIWHCADANHIAIIAAVGLTNVARPKATLACAMTSAETTIWVDGDAVPGPIRDILTRAAVRRQMMTVFVAHHSVRVPKSAYLRSLTVTQGLDAADNYIAESARPGDLVVTADIPLAARAVAAGATAVNPRGTVYTKETIQSHLAQRNLMTDLRDQGVVSGGPAPIGRAHIQAFANALDGHITAMRNRAGS